jgi:hypothetical protein
MSELRFSDSIVVAADPDDVYDLIADISNMGSWSPVCKACWYDDGAGPTVGSWFTGRNELPDRVWETRSKVVAADRGREFAFINHGLAGRHEMVRWGFELRPGDAGGSEVTQTWEVLAGYADGFAEEENPGMTLGQRLDLMKALALKGMPETLANIKDDAEAGT